MVPTDGADAGVPRIVVRWLAVAAVGVVLLVGGLVWDVVGHGRDPALAHQEVVLTVSNPAHAVFLVGLVTVVMGVAGAAWGAFAAATAGRAGRRGGKLAALAAVLIVVAASAALVAVSSAGDAADGDAPRAAAVRPEAPAPAAPAAHHDQQVGAHRQHEGSGCAPTAAQRAAADRLFADTKASVSRFAALTTATSEGYRPVTPPAWSTVHYANPAYIEDGRILDPSRPEALIYANTARGPVLAAGMYLMNRPGEPGPEVGGCLTKWHTHTDLCFSPETLQVVGLVAADGTCTPDSLPYVPPDMMHVWVVEVPGGPFAHEVDGAALARSLSG